MFPSPVSGGCMSEGLGGGGGGGAGGGGRGRVITGIQPNTRTQVSRTDAG